MFERITGQDHPILLFRGRSSKPYKENGIEQSNNSLPLLVDKSFFFSTTTTKTFPLAISWLTDWQAAML